jgi:AcrR family transcriptional regulator
MSRTYTLRKRAEQQAETRRRIVEATIELHSSVGPANTTFSMIAERAGVQRHTLYAHFPDERSLSLACSGLHYERDPLPSAAAWREIGDTRERLATGLRAIYDWYGRNEMLVACVLRDAEIHPLTQEIVQLRFVPFATAWTEVLGAGLNAKQGVMLRLAISFYCWRTLARESGLGQSATVEAMVQAIESARV